MRDFIERHTEYRGDAVFQLRRNKDFSSVKGKN